MYGHDDESGIETMKFYTVQGADHWRKSKESGVLTGGTALTHVDLDWHPAYKWMRDQMSRRLKTTSGDFPVWGFQWGTFHTFQPDERWGPVGEKMVVLGFEVPAERVLLSDFMAWHAVLGNVPLSEEERAFSEEEKLASWNRIFDLDNLEGWSDGTLQGCIDKVAPTEVFMEQAFIIEPLADNP